MRQESQNNTKPEFIFCHSCQAIAIVVKAATSYFALPLACHIHEGVVFSNRDHRTLLDKLVALFFSLGIASLAYLVGDAYYASRNSSANSLTATGLKICAWPHES